MVPVFAEQYVACMSQGLPIAVAPNVNVSLVMLPWESRWLVSKSTRRRFALKEAKMAAMRKMFAHRFYANLRKHDAMRRGAAAS